MRELIQCNYRRLTMMLLQRKMSKVAVVVVVVVMVKKMMLDGEVYEDFHEHYIRITIPYIPLIHKTMVARLSKD
jgi:hypothetical protein